MSGTNGIAKPVPTEPGPASVRPDPEVPERAHRRQFTAAYKLRILAEADACAAPGQLGALLRREGLYSSHLSEWRRLRSQGTLAALAPQRRGRPSTAAHSVELAHLRQENEQLTRQLAAAEAIIEIQKKVSSLLALIPPSANADGRS
jgi:transposase-like protein